MDIELAIENHEEVTSYPDLQPEYSTTLEAAAEFVPTCASEVHRPESPLSQQQTAGAAAGSRFPTGDAGSAGQDDSTPLAQDAPAAMSHDGQDLSARVTREHTQPGQNSATATVGQDTHTDTANGQEAISSADTAQPNEAVAESAVPEALSPAQALAEEPSSTQQKLEMAASGTENGAHAEAAAAAVATPVPAARVSRLLGAGTAAVSSLSSLTSGITGGLAGGLTGSLGSLRNMADGVNVGAAVSVVKSLASAPPPSVQSPAPLVHPAAKPVPSSTPVAPASKGHGQSSTGNLSATSLSSFSWSSMRSLGTLPQKTSSSRNSLFAQQGSDAAALAKLCNLDLEVGPTHATGLHVSCAGVDIPHLLTAGLAVLVWYRVYPERDQDGATTGFRYCLLPGVKGGRYQPSVDDVGCRVLVKARATALGRGLLRSHGMHEQVSQAYGMGECSALDMDAKVPVEAEQRVKLGSARFRAKVVSDSTAALEAGRLTHAVLTPKEMALVEPPAPAQAGKAAAGPSSDPVTYLRIPWVDSLLAWAEPSLPNRLHIQYQDMSVQPAQSKTAVQEPGNPLPASSPPASAAAFHFLIVDMHDAFARDVLLLTLRAWAGHATEPGIAIADAAGWNCTAAPAEDAPSDDDEGDEGEGAHSAAQALPPAAQQQLEAEDNGRSGQGQDGLIEVVSYQPERTQQSVNNGLVIGLDDFLGGGVPVTVPPGPQVAAATAGESLLRQQDSTSSRPDFVLSSAVAPVTEQAAVPGAGTEEAVCAVIQSDNAGAHVQVDGTGVSLQGDQHGQKTELVLQEQEKMIKILQQQLLSTQREHGSASRRIGELEARTAAFERERQQRESSTAELEAEVKRLRLDLSSTKAKLQASDHRGDTAEADAKAARASVSASVAQAKELTTSVAALKVEVDTLKAQTKELQAAVEQKNEDLERRGRSLKGAAKAADEFKAKWEKAQADFAQLKAQAKEAATAGDNASEEASKASKAMKAAQKEADELRTRLTTLTAEVEGMRESHRKELSEATEAHSAELQAVKAAHAADAAALATAKDAASRADAAATQALARCGEAERAVSALRTERDDLRNAIQAAQDRVKQAEAAREAAESALSRATGEHAELKDLRTRVAALQVQLHGAEGRVSAERAEVKALQDQLNTQQAEVSRLTERLQAAESSEQRIKAAEEAVIKARAEVDAAIGERNSAQRKMESLRKDLSRVMSGAEELQLSTVEEMIASKRALEAKVVRLTEEAAKLREHLSDAYERAAAGAGPVLVPVLKPEAPAPIAAPGQKGQPGAKAGGFSQASTPGKTGAGSFSFLAPPAPGGQASAPVHTHVAPAAAPEPAIVTQMRTVVADLTTSLSEKDEHLQQQREIIQSLASRIKELEARMPGGQDGALA